jgi:4-hydroxythreonine-4-phosphate dehydrogenase
MRPIVGISSGDPCGIGPEVVAKSLASQEIYETCRPMVVSDAGVMEQALEIAKLDLKIHRIGSPKEGYYHHGTIDVLDLHNVDLDRLVYKKVSKMGGKASFEYVEKLIELALRGDVHATVTGPIHKEAINLAGFHYAGHTEIYAALTKTANYAMMLCRDDFRVIHVSTHVSLRNACEMVKKERVHRVIHLAHESLLQLGIANPRIGVAGLNPHAGERGLFGKEEIEEIIPAIEEAKKESIRVEGPVPPDTIFPKAIGGQYDIVVVMYHDQGHIPIKVSGFEYNRKENEWLDVTGVNVTTGLPIIRTSVDHGVAFGKAGEGRASPTSMIQAIKMAVALRKGRIRR